MKININIPVNSKKVRLLSAFLAFLIFALTLTQGFIVIDSQKVGAANIGVNTKTSDTMYRGKKSVDSNYVYTGKLKNSKVTLFDYVSDEEINGNSYNNIWHSVPGGGYDDAFTQFNKQISNNGSLLSSSSNNITIRLMIYDTDYNHYNQVRVNMWDDSNHGTGFVPMKYEGTHSSGQNYVSYVYTVNKNNLGWDPHHIQFDTFKNNGGSRQIVNKKDDSSNSYWITSGGGAHAFHTSLDSNTDLLREYEYNSVGVAENIYSTVFTNPLYVGCFYHGFDPDNNMSTDNNVDDPGLYAPYNKPNYNNFFWQANMGLKPQSSKGDAAVQNLVDSTLSGGVTGNITQNGYSLPYFDKNWSGVGTYMKYYDKDSTTGGEIAFPFYEVLTKANYVAGSGSSSEYAKFYQFNSKDSNLYFHAEDVNGHKGYFEETTTPIHSNMDKVGFFPFNNTDDYNYQQEHGRSNNRGFGTKFEMQFKLQSDGCVGPVDSEGESIDSSNRINTVFEFVGDDDLWVFIDGKLVLDLGGSHDHTEGKIDFAAAKATATKATPLSTSDKDNLGDNTGTREITGANFTSLISGASYNSSTGKPTYDPATTHTITIFYMERGLNDSNLMIRYNYAIEANFSKMKICEVTTFDSVNDGLKSITKKAADNDVFSYQVLNKGTTADDVKDGQILYPTYDTYRRTNSDAMDSPQAQLTGKTPTSSDYVMATDPNALFLKANVWQSSNAVIAAWIWRAASGAGYDGQLYLGELVEGTSDVYRFSGFPNNVDRVIFLRLNPSYEPFEQGSTVFPTSAVLNREETAAYKGKLYRIENNWSLTSANSYDSDYQFRTLYFESNLNFNAPQTEDGNYHSVSNTAYLWVDKLAVLQGTDVDGFNGMNGKTDSSGNFYLMYGTDAKESSAEFERQFKHNSYMRIIQNDLLRKPLRANNATVTEDFSSSSQSTSRSVDYYYTTTVSLSDREYNTLQSGESTAKNSLTQSTVSSNVQTDFEFDHIGINVTDSWPVMLTETFTNAVNVGAISVTKQIKNPNGTVETGSTDEFTFKITLSNVFGSDFNVSDYSGITYTKTGVTGTLNLSNVSGGGSFTLKSGETVTISGIPVGTKYTLTETANSNYNTTGEVTTSKTVAEGTLSGNSTTYTPASGNSETIVNTRKVGSLTMIKQTANTPLTYPSDFSFNGVLTAPSGVDLSQYLNIPAGTVTGTYSNNNKVYSFTATVPTNDAGGVTIGNIPYGTTYQIYESTTGFPSCITSSNTSSNKHSGTISNPSTEKTITNTYNTGSIIITKALAHVSGASEPATAQDYYFTVVLTPETGKTPSVNLSDFNIVCSGTGASMTVNGNTLNVTISGAGTATISGIPYGTGYSISETARSDGSVSSVTSGNSTGTVSASTPTGTVTFTNTYQKQVEMTLGKSVVGSRPAGVPESGNDPEYILLVTLREPSGKQFSSYPVAVSGAAIYSVSGGVPTSTQITAGDITSEVQFAVRLHASGSVAFSGLPDGTEYKAVEYSVSSADTTSHTGEVSSYTAITTSPATAPVIVNKYEVGNLKLIKALASNGGDTVPSDINTKSFKFHITITSPPDIDLTKYVTLSDYADGGTVSSSVNSSDSSRTDYTFTHTFTGQGNILINGLPVGTDYEVYEVTTGSDALPAYLSSDCGSGDTPLSGTITANTTDEKTITNTYSYGKLKLSKTLVGGTNAHTTPGNNYTFKVELTEPSDITFGLLDGSALSASPTYPIGGLTGCTVTYSAKKYTIIISIPSDGTTKELTGIPYGTAYRVTEVVWDDGSFSYKEVTGASNENDPNHPHVTNSPVNGTVKNAETAVNITNLYRKITFTKVDANNSSVKLANAEYYLLKLNSYFDSEYNSGNPAQTLTDAFNNAETYSDLSYYYETAVGNGASGTLKTESSGVITVDDSMIAGGLTPGYYFFFEEAAPTNYERDNSLAGKVFEIKTASPDPDYSITYTDERRTGNLVLEKRLGDATPDNSATSAQEFKYHVVLTAPANVVLGTGTNQYSIGSTRAPETGAAYGTNGSGRSTYTFDVMVSKGTPVTISNIPFGTTYTVEEAAPLPTNWINVSSGGLTGTISSDTPENSTTHIPTATAYTTNGLTGNLVLEKVLAGNSIPSSAHNETFSFDVELTNSSVSDWTKYTIKNGSSTLTRDSSTGKVTLTISGISGTSDSAVISGIPYGTVCTVTETAPSSGGFSVSYSVNNGSAAVGASTPTITVTNTYNDSCSLTLRKRAVNRPSALSGDTYSFAVTLTSASLNYGDISFTPSNKKPLSIVSGTPFNITMSAGEDVVITGLPSDTGYVVTETIPSGGSGYSTSVKVDNGQIQETNSVSGLLSSTNTGDVVTVTNTYPGTHSLKLTKITSGSIPESLGTDPMFKFHVVLTAPASPSGVDLSKYPIQQKVGANGAETDITGITNSNNEFDVWVKAGAGSYVTISGIPEGTVYSVSEDISEFKLKGSGDSYTTENMPTGTGVSVESNPTSVSNLTLSSDSEVTVTNSYKDVGNLKLTKTLLGSDNASLGADPTVTYKVELTEPSGVTFSGNYTITGMDTTASDYSYSGNKHTFYKTVPAGGSVVLENIPFDTAYTVTEVYLKNGSWTAVGSPNNDSHSTKPTVLGNPATGTIGSGTVVSNINVSEATITNKFRSVTLTKTDSKDDSFEVDGAKYILLRLKPDLVIDASVRQIFGSASGINDLHPANDPENKFWEDHSTELTTGASPFQSGQIVVNDSNMGQGLIDGRYVFFETSPASDYTRDNTLSDNRIITIDSADTNAVDYAYTTAANAYTDPRNTGSLELIKLLTSDTDAAAYGDTVFTYSVTLTQPDDLDLTDFIDRDDLDGQNGIGATVTVYTPESIEFTVPVTADTSKTISGIPYGTVYTVSEGASSGWEEITSTYSDLSTPHRINAAAQSYTVKNAKTGSLELNKDFKGSLPSGTSFATTFDFKVTLFPTSDAPLSECTLINETTSQAITLDNDNSFVVSVSKNVPVTISGIPVGTKYTLEEINEPSNVRASGEVDANHKGTIVSAGSSETITNVYYGSLVLSKELSGDTSLGSTILPYIFKVTLTEPSDVSFMQSVVDSFSVLEGFVKTGRTYTFYVPVYAGSSHAVTIDDLPYGTTYSVEETSVLSRNQTKSGEVLSDAPGTINMVTNSVEITNTYPGSLTLKKKIEGTRPFGVSSLTNFTFNVTLTSSSAENSSFTVRVGLTNRTVTSGQPFTVRVSEAASVTISDIPIGTSYTVTEVQPSPIPQSVTGEVTTAKTITAEDPVREEEIVNNYDSSQEHKGIVLLKEDETTNDALSGVKFYLLKLRPDTDITDPDVKNAFANSVTVSDLTDPSDPDSYYADIVTGLPDSENDIISTDSEGYIIFYEPSVSVNTGDRYFFYEVEEHTVAVAGDDPIEYERDNTLSSEKLITIDGSQTLYQVTYYNRRKADSAAGSVSLTKIAKNSAAGFEPGDKLGAGYGFLLYRIKDDGTAETVNRIIKKKGSSEYYYIPSDANIGSARYQAMLGETDANGHVWEVNNDATDFIYYNTASLPETITTAMGRTPIVESKYIKALVTDDDSMLYVDNLPLGRYYFEEVGTPSDSAYSKNYIHGWVEGSDNQYCTDTDGEYIYQDRISNEFYYDQVQNRTTFDICENNASDTAVAVTSADEMTPAYIRLFEHINEWRPDEWGNPTFIFKIKQTHSYVFNGDDPKNPQYSPVENGKEYIVALTVDDEGKMTMDSYSSEYDNWYLETTVNNYSGKTGANVADNILSDNSDDNRYGNERLFGLIKEGFLEVEPGKYTVSRIDPSRYEYVESYSECYTSTNGIWAESVYDPETDQFIRSMSGYRKAYDPREEEYSGVIKDGERTTFSEETIEELEVLPYRVVDLHYYDKVSYYDKFSQADTRVNKFYQTENGFVTTVKGIRLEFRGMVEIPDGGSDAEIEVNAANNESLSRFSLNGTALNAYFICSDGSERAMSAEEKEKLVISFLTDDPNDTFDDDFVFDEEAHRIIIENPSDHAGCTFTLTASYDGSFSTDFDIFLALVGETP